MSSNTFDEKSVTVFDGSNFLLWSDQMKGFLQSRRLWRIVSGALVAPAAVAAGLANPALDSWLAADEEAQGILVLKIAASLRTGIFVAANNTAAMI
jgi:hypothetical protein